MNQTKIEWCDCTWNPVTGCLHGCPYCYARRIATRFCTNEFGKKDGLLSDLHCSQKCQDCSEMDGAEFVGKKVRYAYEGDGPFPFGFLPTLYKNRLSEPESEKKPRNIFAVSMGDLFGDWVPESWIREVFAACERAPQHRYLFLTKNPARYQAFFGHDGDPERRNFWLGTSVSGDADYYRAYGLIDFHSYGGKFLSIEPVLSELHDVKRFLALGSTYHRWIDWVIIGAETGNRKGKVIPKREWIEKIVEACNTAGIPVFMKNSLALVWGAPLIREFPWEDQHGNRADKRA